MFRSLRQDRVQLAHSILIFFQADGIDNRSSRIGFDGTLECLHRKGVEAHDAFKVAGQCINCFGQYHFGFHDIAIHTNINDVDAQILDLLFHHFFQSGHLDAIVSLHRFTHFFTTPYVQPFPDADQTLGTVQSHRFLRTRNINLVGR